MSAFKPIASGTVYGRWTVLGPSPVGKNGHRYWECRCQCGKERAVAAVHLRGGKSTSCGCAKGGKRTHGRAKTRTYRIWSLMKARCSNSNLPDFKHYGGRGIKVCERWRSSFENFLADMGEAPDNLSIDREDNNKHYEPGNCRWATQKEQTRNQRRTVWLTLDGKTLSLPEWGEITGLDVGCLFWRYQEGWAHERILTTPSRRRAA